MYISLSDFYTDGCYFVSGSTVAALYATQCVCFSLLLWVRDQQCSGIESLFYFNSIQAVGSLSADANMKRFQCKVLYAKKKTSQSMDEFRLSQQCVANAFLRQMNIQIHAWPQNLMNICQMNIFVYRYSIHIYSNIYNVKKKKK